jgi:PAS domain S-box-containing protein
MTVIPIPENACETREPALRVLILEDSTTDAELVVRELQRTGRPIDFERVETTAAMRAALERAQWDIVIADWSTPMFSGRAALDLLKELRLDLPFIIVSGTLGEEHAVEAIRAGAHDYVLKHKLDRLSTVIERELRESAARSARQQVELAQRQAEARMRRMIESARVGVWFVGVEGKTSFINHRMAQIVGLSAEEAADASIADFIDGEDQPGFAECLEQRKAGITGSYEHKFRCKDGSVGWGVFESSPLSDADGRFEGVLTVMTDITAQRKSLEAQRDAERCFKRLFDSRITGVTIANLAGAITEANDTFLEMVGYTRDDLRAGALDWVEMTPVEWRILHTSAGDELRARGSTRSFEKEYVRKDGTRLPVLVGLALLDDSRVLTVVTDLTDCKQAEERKAAVVDAALDAVIGMDHAGAVTEFNPSAERTFGYARSEVLGRPLVDLLVPPRLRSQHRAGLERYLATGEGSVIGKRIERTAIRRDGTEFAVELSVSRVGSGTASSFVGFVRDISDRKLAEAALDERMRVAALAADVGMALTGDETASGILQRCCEAMVRHLGAAFARIWTLNTVTQTLELKASAGIYTHLDGPHSRIPVGQLEVGRIASERRSLHSNDLQHNQCAGDRDWARREGLRTFAGHPLLIGGELVGVMAMFAREPLSDVTLRGLASVADAIAVRIHGELANQANIALEEQLRHAQKMEAVGRLAGGIAHDFNNVLSVVLSYSELVIADLKKGDPIRDDIEQIWQAGVRAADLTRQLLMFSRQQVMEPKVLELNDVLSGMDKMLQRLVGEDVELASSAGAALGRVRVDPGSIEQVIMNLVVNARDAMPTGGQLTLETANVELDEEYAASHHGAKPGPHIMLSVTDTGSGMDHATLARIFEPFFTTKEKGKGTGLGLSTVFGIVQQSGGNIWVYSEPGVGTTFKIYLPRVDDLAEELRAQTGPMTLRGSETILLVEDEPQVRDVARGILARHGYTVIEARSPGEAILACERTAGPIHLLLSDVVMPHMSGPELARRLVQTRPEMKVLCMSGYTDDSVVRHGLIGAELAYLQKPITVAALTRKVREVLGPPPR